MEAERLGGVALSLLPLASSFGTQLFSKEKTMMCGPKALLGPSGQILGPRIPHRRCGLTPHNALYIRYGTYIELAGQVDRAEDQGSGQTVLAWCGRHRQDHQGYKLLALPKASVQGKRIKS